MKLFHLSDLHIGKRVNEFSMIEDQKYILSQILHAAKIKKPDGILLSGDIYDSTIPSAEAVQVFDAFLTELSVERIPAFIISGNHDSAERLAFGSSLMGKSGIYFSRVYDGTIEKIPLQDAYGTVWIHLLPFLRPAVVRHALPERAEEVSYAADAVRIALEQGAVDENERNVLLAHQFVTGAKRCEAEELQVGDLDQIPVELFERFDYVALGHIHRPQSMGRESIRYCGSMLKYSVSEWEQEKSVTEVILEAPGQEPVIQLHPLHPLREICVIRGRLEEILEANKDSICEDYVSIVLTDEEELYQPKEQLERIFTHILEVRTERNRKLVQEWEDGQAEDTQSDPKLVFEQFFSQIQGRKLQEEEAAVLEEVFAKIREEEG